MHNPFLTQKLDVHIGQALESIAQDKEQSNTDLTLNIVCPANSYFLYLLTEPDMLFLVVHEKLGVPKGRLAPHLWCYRPPVTLEQLRQVLQQEKVRCLILEEFLKKVNL